MITKQVRHPSSAPAEVYPVPPLARKNDARRSLDLSANDKIVRFMQEGGIRHLIYGGNAFLYHATLADYGEMIDWLGGLTGDLSIMPAVGPSYGRALDQAPFIRRHNFASVLALPCGDPRDPAGMETGLREIAEACGTQLTLYLKDELNFGPDKEAGLDVVARLVDAKVCTNIKYAVVREDPSVDAYLDSLVSRVDPSHIISGIGERPAIIHLRNWKLNGYTTGSGCIAPRLTRELLTACLQKDYAQAEEIRRAFIPLEDLRDSWGPSRVLHSAMALSGIAETGPVLPFISGLSPAQLSQLKPVSQALLESNARMMSAV